MEGLGTNDTGHAPGHLGILLARETVRNGGMRRGYEKNKDRSRFGAAQRMTIPTGRQEHMGIDGMLVGDRSVEAQQVPRQVAVTRPRLCDDYTLARELSSERLVLVRVLNTQPHGA
jgi:hypothetical protein